MTDFRVVDHSFGSLIACVNCSRLHFRHVCWFIYLLWLVNLFGNGLTREKSAGTGCVLCLETEDVETALSKAVSAGAVADGEIEDGDGVSCGGRVGKLKDPYGFTWFICSPVETCKDEEKEESRKL